MRLGDQPRPKEVKGAPNLNETYESDCGTIDETGTGLGIR